MFKWMLFWGPPFAGFVGSICCHLLTLNDRVDDLSWTTSRSAHTWLKATGHGSALKVLGLRFGPRKCVHKVRITTIETGEVKQWLLDLKYHVYLILIWYDSHWQKRPPGVLSSVVLARASGIPTCSTRERTISSRTWWLLKRLERSGPWHQRATK